MGLCGVYFLITDNLGRPVSVFNSSMQLAAAMDDEPFGGVNTVTLNREGSNYAGIFASFGQPIGGAYAPTNTTVDFRVRLPSITTGSVSIIDGASNNLYTTYYLTSGLVTPWLTSPSGGRASVMGTPATAVMQGYQYRRYQVGAVPFQVPLRFPGQYFDEETQLHQNWNRFYDPNTGRYLESEPMLAQSKRPRIGVLTGAS